MNDLINTQLFDPLIPYLFGTGPGNKYVIFIIPRNSIQVDNETIMKYFEADATLEYVGGESNFKISGTIRDQSLFDYFNHRLATRGTIIQWA